MRSVEKYSSRQERPEKILPRVASGRTFSYNPLSSKPVSMLGHNPPWCWRGNYAKGANPNRLWIGFALKKDKKGGFWQLDLACHICIHLCDGKLWLCRRHGTSAKWSRRIYQLPITRGLASDRWMPRKNHDTSLTKTANKSRFFLPPEHSLYRAMIQPASLLLQFHMPYTLRMVHHLAQLAYLSATTC